VGDESTKNQKVSLRSRIAAAYNGGGVGARPKWRSDEQLNSVEVPGRQVGDRGCGLMRAKITPREVLPRACVAFQVLSLGAD
jgi:hypothetical protein